MDLSSSWDPTTSTNGLSAFPAFALIQTYDESPSSEVLLDDSWTKRQLMPYLTGSGDGSEAIWKCVLAIWRLRALGKDLGGGGEPFCALWQQRHYDLCQHNNIPPLNIVTRYQTLGSTQVCWKTGETTTHRGHDHVPVHLLEHFWLGHLKLKRSQHKPIPAGLHSFLSLLFESLSVSLHPLVHSSVTS
ncbi:hypothetical protein BJ322DRAFT_1017057 [Thelephora terrestris]|uniref:Uncharacterized protein n=1 Tax=Thelephora terrestris TaxID=56493 RepID=A0A9P6HLR2_9AGAM|nr:hypothetical protein BJ322DRAFT_1017057 [Thelephora terrestris]